MLRQLIENGANINAVNAENNTALSLAIKNGIPINNVELFILAILFYIQANLYDD